VLADKRRNEARSKKPDKPRQQTFVISVRLAGASLSSTWQKTSSRSPVEHHHDGRAIGSPRVGNHRDRIRPSLVRLSGRKENLHHVRKKEAEKRFQTKRKLFIHFSRAHDSPPLPPPSSWPATVCVCRGNDSKVQPAKPGLPYLPLATKGKPSTLSPVCPGGGGLAPRGRHVEGWLGYAPWFLFLPGGGPGAHNLLGLPCCVERELTSRQGRQAGQDARKCLPYYIVHSMYSMALQFTFPGRMPGSRGSQPNNIFYL
jgi:hypothetical protein